MIFSFIAQHHVDFASKTYHIHSILSLLLLGSNSLCFSLMNSLPLSPSEQQSDIVSTTEPSGKNIFSSTPTLNNTPSHQPSSFSQQQSGSVCGMLPSDRKDSIFAILDTVSEPKLLRNEISSRGKAAKWLVEQDAFLLCPSDTKLIQRYVLALLYFSTNGDSWLQCTSTSNFNNCGMQTPFQGAFPYLSDRSECDWAGISCNGRGIAFKYTVLKKSNLTKCFYFLNFLARAVESCVQKIDFGKSNMIPSSLFLSV